MSEQVILNGIDGETGEYLQPPLTVENLANLARRKDDDHQHLKELKWRHDKAKNADFAPIEGIDASDLSQTGWGVVFAHNADPQVKEALQPLLDWRRSEAAAKNENFYKEFIGKNGFLAVDPPDTKPKFTDRHGAGGSGVVNPANGIPYYLLLVGDPESIPFRFQYQMDVQYAVGRIHFDSLDDYERYAKSVVAAEKGKLALERKVTFFGAANPGDLSTELSSTRLIAPLSEIVRTDQPKWNVEVVKPQDALKKKLGRLMGGTERPALLFTATHGVGLKQGNPNQFTHNGALVCQDWPGPGERGSFNESVYFTAAEVDDDADFHGMVAMMFACFGAGTPKFDDFPETAKRGQVAPRGFLSALPLRMLANKKGGALAVVGHVERAWQYSFEWRKSREQMQTFQSTMKRLMEGARVGYAMEFFNSRYAELSSDLTDQLVEDQIEKDDLALAGLWTANKDARNYAVIGDPAVRLNVADKAAAVDPSLAREVLELRSSKRAVTGTLTAPQETVEAPGLEVSFGILDTMKDAQTRLQAVMQGVMEKIGTALSATVDGLTTVEVASYSSDALANVKYVNGKFEGAQLRALTRIGMDGKTLVCVPERDGKVDEALWKIHTEALERALQNRTEMLKLAANAASTLLSSLKAL